ncbi:MAG TPA: class I SAM-dependent methyltransferase [Bacteroidia bacterium]|nr:class I SAM-dependent methyltransferase [Bacteroidia bacterium]
MAGTETAFDNYALSYDADFTHSSIGVLQRKRVWNFLSRHLSSQTHADLLEINCGTGEDALWFCGKGFNVTASDISNEMVGVAREKLRGKKATVFQSDILAISEKIRDKKFDVIFSDFGGLNCLSPDELKKMSEIFSALLNPGGRLIFVVMGRNCKWERWYFKRKGDVESAFRRRSQTGIEAIIFDQKVSTWYYSPEEMIGYFAGNFSVNTFKPIGISIPPSYLDNYFRKRTARLKILNGLEKLLGNFSSLSDKADHYIIDFSKK